MSSKKKMSKIQFYSNLIYITFSITILLQYYKIITVISSQIILLICGLIAFIFTLASKQTKEFLKVFSLILVMLFFGLLSYIYNKNLDLQEFFWPIAYYGIALLFITNKVDYKTTRFILYIFFFISLVFILLSGNSISSNNINTSLSRNHINIHLLLFFTAHSLNSIKYIGKINFFDVLISFLISILSYGRSGILVFGFYLIVLGTFDFKFNKFNKFNVRRILTFIFLLIIFYFFSSVLANPFSESIIESLQNRGFESVRTFIWRDYLLKTGESFLNVLFGTNISGTYFLDTFSHNLHNSFLMLHAKYGLIVFLLILLLIILKIKTLIIKKNILLFLLLFGLLFRMSFDYTNFNSILDVLFVAIIFGNYDYSNRKELSNEQS